MKITASRGVQGIALIIVLICITVLSILAAGFAYSMKVETKLAMTSNSENEITWIGYSGVEYARWFLAQSAGCPYSSLNQKWAGGPGGDCETNGPIAEVSLTEPYQIGHGQFTVVKVTDLERRVNINRLVLEMDPAGRQQILEQAFRLIGVDNGEFTSLANSITDWIDYDNNPGSGGAESETYQGRTPPYYARNRPIDDLSDLLLVKGVTYEMYAGGEISKFESAAFQARQRTYGNNAGTITYPVGLTNLFTCFGSTADGAQWLNINTAPSEVLQLIPGVDENIAGAIIERRNEAPFININDVDVPVLNPQIRGQIQRLCGVKSRTFEVVVRAEINGYSRYFVSVVGRNTPRDCPMLTFSWKE